MDRNTSLKASIAARPQPDAAQATLADRRHETVWADRLSYQRGLVRDRCREALQEVFFRRGAMFCQQLLQKIRQLRLLHSKGMQPGSALLLTKGKRLVQVRTYFLPSLWSQLR